VTPNRLRILVVVILLVVVIGAYFMLFSRPSLGDIAAHPARFAGRTVSVAGTVESPTGQGFWISDSTGRLYVATPSAAGQVPLESTRWQGQGVVKADQPRPDGSTGAVVEVAPQ